MYRSSKLLGLGMMAAALMAAMPYQEPEPRKTRVTTKPEGGKEITKYSPEPQRPGKPHQGQREMARRMKRMQKGDK